MSPVPKFWPILSPSCPLFPWWPIHFLGQQQIGQLGRTIAHLPRQWLLTVLLADYFNGSSRYPSSGLFHQRIRRSNENVDSKVDDSNVLPMLYQKYGLFNLHLHGLYPMFHKEHKKVLGSDKPHACKPVVPHLQRILNSNPKKIEK